jgi:hypothetical protein
MALGTAAAEFGRRGGTFLDLAHYSCVGVDTARTTLKNMTAIGELEIVGQTRIEGVNRPVNLYAVPLPPEPLCAELDDVVRCWADFR